MPNRKFTTFSRIPPKVMNAVFRAIVMPRLGAG
jgi:hypothetical protein